MKKTVDFYEKMELVMLGVYISYQDGKPIWLLEWDEDNFRTYSDVLEISDMKLKPHFSVFISCQTDELNYVARARKDRNVVTKKTRVFFEKVFKLRRPIKFSEILQNSNPQMKSSLNNMINSKLSKITANRWNAINSYLFANDKEQHQLIKAILEAKSKKADVANNKTIITNHEKDAIGLCLRIAGINNQFNNLAIWDTENTTTPEFLRNVSHAPLREDQMINNDFRFFGDWGVINEFTNNVSVFSDGISRVSIMNVNRTPIETTLGVDLFYYNHSYQNYIFVQYKRLRKNGKSYGFNIKSDSNFMKEMERMSEAERIFGKESEFLKSLEDYRLSKEIFYFKFCKDDQEILSKDLSKGMYLPKSFMNEFINTFNHKTVSYENINRYFNNTMFIDLVKTGLFGSQIKESKEITKLINTIISTGKSVILAVNSKVNNEYDY